VDGEAVGAVVLKPLARAIADGDHLYGVIRGSMLNAGGRTNGYTVPNPSAQERAISEALRRAGVSPRMVSYVEAHGTGTELGDPIEISGLTRAFERETHERQFCALGSAKSNIGHCERAAGIAGLIKVLLQMRHRELVPSLHASTPNPRIDFRNTPFVVQQALGPWARPRVLVDGSLQEVPRIAGLSSFGAGGANAHLVVEEYADERGAPAESGGPALIVLSARTERDLEERARQLVALIEDEPLGDEALADVAYTLQVGREAMEERLGIIAGSVEALREALVAFGRGERPAACRRGRAAPGDGGEADPGEGRKRIVPWGTGALEAGLSAWLEGRRVDWSQLHQGRRPRRISLPTYPFAGERFWAPAQRGRAGVRALAPGMTAKETPSAPATPEVAAKGKEAGRPVRLKEPGVVGGAPAAALGARAEVRGRPQVRLRPLPPPLASRPPPEGEGRQPLASGALEATPVVPSTPEPMRTALAPRAKKVEASGAAELRPPRRAVEAQARPEAPPAPGREGVVPSLRDELTASLAKALYMEPGDVELDKKFVDMGLDSIVGVEWIKALNKTLGTSLKATIVYDHPSIRSFERFLKGELGRERSVGPIEVDAPRPGDGEQPVEVEQPSSASGEQTRPPPASQSRHRDKSPSRSARSLRELLLQVQQGEVSVEEASRLHFELRRLDQGGASLGGNMSCVLSEVRSAGGSDV
jgi:acyl transferase domain-containing protein